MRPASNPHPSQSVTVAAKSKLELEVGYSPQEAYMVSCDRFATRVHFDVDGEPIVALAEHRVTRRTVTSHRHDTALSGVASDRRIPPPRA